LQGARPLPLFLGGRRTSGRGATPMCAWHVSCMDCLPCLRIRRAPSQVNKSKRPEQATAGKCKVHRLCAAFLIDTPACPRRFRMRRHGRQSRHGTCQVHMAISDFGSRHAKASCARYAPGLLETGDSLAQLELGPVAG
jgi:hypothetical protein